jgi:hypothetical protein
MRNILIAIGLCLFLKRLIKHWHLVSFPFWPKRVYLQNTLQLTMKYLITILVIVTGLFITLTTQATTIFPANNGFEVPDLGSGPDAFLYNPPGASWTFVSNSGIAANSSRFFVSNAPNGNSDGTMSTAGQAAFLQGFFGNHGEMFQTVSLSAGFVSVDFLLEQRMIAAGSDQIPGQITVTLDGTFLGSFSTTSTSDFVPEMTLTIPITAGVHTLDFIQNIVSTDATDFVDSVSLNNTATVPDLGPGMLLVAFVFGALIYFHQRMSQNHESNFLGLGGLCI